MYVLGVDAGGTKTHCAVADETGRIVGEGFSGPANHQTCGRERTKQSLQEAVGKALSAAGLEKKDITCGVFGMSGADGEDDFILLNDVVGEIMGNVSFEVMHDGWIGFRSAVDGNMGGGGELAQQAMHYAFRSNEGTWEKTALEEELPGLFHVETMDQVCAIVKNRDIPAEQQFQLPRLVFRLADEGDPVCREIISRMGYEEGRYAAAIIRRLHMEEEKVPVVLIGSLFGTRNPLLIEPYMEAVHQAALGAYPVIPEAAPVTGAIKIALENCRKR